MNCYITDWMAASFAAPQSSLRLQAIEATFSDTVRVVTGLQELRVRQNIGPKRGRLLTILQSKVWPLSIFMSS